MAAPSPQTAHERVGGGGAQHHECDADEHGEHKDEVCTQEDGRKGLARPTLHLRARHRNATERERGSDRFCVCVRVCV